MNKAEKAKNKAIKSKLFQKTEKTVQKVYKFAFLK